MSVLIRKLAVPMLMVSGGVIADESTNLASLGAAIFNDKNLSINGSQSCSTCHMAEHAFIDARGVMSLKSAVSQGAIEGMIGSRNAPTLTYVGVTPSFRATENGFKGGMFLDGRAESLTDQALKPMLNPAEMALESEQDIYTRVVANDAYRKIISAYLEKPEQMLSVADVVSTTAIALAEFQKTSQFILFDSKYDRYLKGEYEMTQAEELGMTLFFSDQFTNCNQCHQLNKSPTYQAETFSDYSYHNIGVPANEALVAAIGAGFVDPGLAQNPSAEGQNNAGKFKVPTLRNVAVTAPYMHNGVFTDLETVVRFYNKYNSRVVSANINPETGSVWGAPEYAGNISVELLEHGPALDTVRVEALVAFMKTLTDARYEHLVTND